MKDRAVKRSWRSIWVGIVGCAVMLGVAHPVATSEKSDAVYRNMTYANLIPDQIQGDWSYHTGLYEGYRIPPGGGHYELS
jgi:hypothetical protein